MKEYLMSVIKYIHFVCCVSCGNKRGNNLYCGKKLVVGTRFHNYLYERSCRQ